MTATRSPPSLRVIVTGGRAYRNTLRIRGDLQALYDQCGLHRVAQGGADGADDLARLAWSDIRTGGDLGEKLRILLSGEDRSETYEASADLDGSWPEAGCSRNIRMLDAEVALARRARNERLACLAYPDPYSRGTWHCVGEALRRGLPVYVRSASAAETLAAKRTRGFSSMIREHLISCGPELTYCELFPTWWHDEQRARWRDVDDVLSAIMHP